MSTPNSPGQKTILASLLNRSSTQELLYSNHAKKLHDLLRTEQTVEEVRDKGALLLNGQIVLENEGFLVFYLPGNFGFYIYSKELNKFISMEISGGGEKGNIFIFRHILEDDTGEGIYIEIESKVWMHLSNKMQAIDFKVQRNSKGEKTHLFMAPSNMADEDRRALADTMGSGGHIRNSSRFASIHHAIDPYTGVLTVLAITPDITLH